MCGITAAIGKEINLWKLQIASRANDHRGGDGVGYWSELDGAHKWIDHGNFSIFFDKLSFISEKILSKCVIMHTRKATKGSKKVENLHPFVISDKFIFCHNGTIHNISKLLEKYPLDNFDPTDKVDSYVMGRIIEKHGYDVLIDYRGMAAFVWTDNNGKTIKVFRGSSKNGNYVTSSSDERPLYMLKTEKALYFNSLESGLNYIKLSSETVKEVPSNIVLEFDSKMEIISEKSFDRSNSFQVEEYTPTNFVSNSEKYVNKYCTGKIVFNNKKQYFQDGFFFDKKGKALTGAFKLEKDRLVFVNMDLHDNFDCVETFLLKDGVIIDKEVFLKRYQTVKTMSDFKNISVQTSVLDNFSVFPIRFGNGGYWRMGKSLLKDDITYIMPVINKSFKICEKGIFEQNCQLNLFEKENEKKLHESDLEKSAIECICFQYGLDKKWFNVFYNLGKNTEKLCETLNNSIKSHSNNKKNNIFAQELLKILNFCSIFFFKNETADTLNEVLLFEYLVSYEGNKTLHEILFEFVNEYIDLYNPEEIIEDSDFTEVLDFPEVNPFDTVLHSDLENRKKLNNFKNKNYHGWEDEYGYY